MEQTKLYDVVIIGGGPAGSTHGTFLARKGYRVLILEREVFPRFHIGESLLPYGNDILKESGAWEKVEKAGFMPKLGAEFCTGNAFKSRCIWFAKGLIPGYGKTFQVERAKFDHILLNHAAECGCTIQEGAKVEEVKLNDSEARVSYIQNGMKHEVSSRWLVDASGRDAFLGRYFNIPKHELDIPKRTATYAHYTGVFRNSGEMEGHITVVRLEGGWFWIIPLDKEKTSVGMVQEVERLRQSGMTPEKCLEATIEESTELRFRMKDAVRVSEYHTSSNYCYAYKKIVGPRMIMIGDSGGFIDPIFSSGVMIALKSGQIAADWIAQADAEGRPFSHLEQSHYTEELHALRKAFSKMISFYYEKHGFEVFINPQSRYKVVEAVNSLLAGHIEMKFNHWWRVQFFYVICAFQRWFKIAPRLDYREGIDIPQSELKAREMAKAA
jgi:flavin-dependent dehydrogenase